MPDLSEEQKEKLPPRVEVELSFNLDASGKILSTSVEKGSGHSDVDTQVIQALRSWRFEEREGAPPVRGSVRIILSTN